MNKVIFSGRRDKLKTIAGLFPDIFSGDTLDVGCGNSLLKQFVKGEYTGVDKVGFPDVRQDISKGLRFDDRAFDAVAGFDVLEHLDDIHFAFDELCRVSKKWVVITLPNMYEWRFRILFLLGKPISGKYILSGNPPSDRHKWLFSLKQARCFVKERARKNRFELSEEALCYYGYSRILPRIISRVGMRLGARFQGAFADRYLVALKRK